MLLKMQDPLSLLYLAGFKLHQSLSKPRRLDAKVICVGNLSVGGAGKTPLVIHLVNALIKAGHNPAVLSRGYKSRARGLRIAKPDSDPRAVGDEPVLIARKTGVPVFVCENRYRAGLAGVEAGYNPLVMDDGFQNTHVIKDLCVVVIPSSDLRKPVRLLPTGRWREPLSALKRARIAVINYKFDPVDPELPELGVDVAGMRYISSVDLRGQRLFGFSGLGDNASFKRALIRLGADLVGFRSFPDHHFYSTKQLQELEQAADRLRAKLITTQKDAVRLGQGFSGLVLDIGVEIFPPDALSFVYD